MSDAILEALLDTIKDTATLIPFLFITYLAMEWLEDKTEDQSVALLSRMGRARHVIGAGIGLVPQCGFSAAAAGLYSGGVITVGTMLAVFLSTSDEMLPIFISSSVSANSIFKILAVKFAFALATGILIDLAIKTFKFTLGGSKHIHDLCEQDHCGCEDEEGSIVRSALVHTAKIVVFIFIASFVIGLIAESLGKDVVASVLSGAPVLGTFICSLVGLIPNCAASVIIAELYLENMISAGQMMAGLLVSAGVGILVLCRSNRNRKENALIIAMLYFSGVIWGLLTDIIGLTF